MTQRNVIRNLVPWMLRHTWLLALIGVGLTIWAYSGIQQLTVQSNFVDLLPDKQPEVIELRHLQDIVGGASYMILTLEPAQPELAPPFLHALMAQLEGHPDVRYIDYKPPSAFLHRNALLYMDGPEFEEMAEKLKRRIDRLKLQDVMVDLGADDDEEWNLVDLEEQYPFIRQDKHYRNADGTLFVMLIKPRGRATDTTFTKKLLGDVHTAIDQARTTLGDSYSPDQLHYELTGPYVKALTQTASVMADAKRVAMLSLVGMSCVLLIYFRRKRALIIIALPLIMGIMWALGLAQVMFGSLNFFTAVVCAVLLGLSADIGIHLWSHYVEQRRMGLAPHAAIIETYRDLYRPMGVATFTTATAFFALAISDFKPLYQFGIIAGVGMICALCAMYLIFPGITLFFERIAPLQLHVAPPRTTAMAKVGLPHLIAPRRFFGISLLLAATLIPTALGWVEFDYNYANIMGSQTTRDLDDRVDSIFQYSINPEIARAETAADAGAFAKAIRTTSRAYREQYGSSTVQTSWALNDFVPGNQREKIDRIAELRSAFTEAVVALMPDKEREVYDRFEPALNPTSVRMIDLPDSLITKFRDLRGNVGQFLYIFPAFDRQDGRKLEQFVKEIRAVDCTTCKERVVITGESVVFYEIVHRLLRKGRLAVGTSLFAIALALLIAFRHWGHAMRCFVPLGVGMIAVLGVMGMVGVKFTIVNIAAIPVLLGTGIDYIVYYYQQVRQQGPNKFHNAYLAVAPPILASAITTACGFGALLTADNNGANSFGAVTLIGIIVCALTTLLWFPGWLTRLRTQGTDLYTDSSTTARPNPLSERIPTT